MYNCLLKCYLNLKINLINNKMITILHVMASLISRSASPLAEGFLTFIIIFSILNFYFAAVTLF